MPLGRLLSASDYVILTAPLTADTWHMIDKNALAAMKSTAFLINISRGDIVDEDALAHDLKALKGLRDAGRTSSAGELRSEVEENAKNGIHPQALLDLESEDLGFRVFLSWAASRPDGAQVPVQVQAADRHGAQGARGDVGLE